MPELALKVPRELRRGGRANDEEDSVTSGLGLINLICRELGIPDLGGKSLLDMGCGTKLIQAFLTYELPLAAYVGVDVYREQIEFLKANVQDPRFDFYHLDLQNEMYNPGGEPLSGSTLLPVAEHSFDLISLFSVFTHLAPHDYVAMLEMLRRYIKPDGKLIYSLFVSETTSGGHGFMDSVARNLKLSDEQIANWQGPPPFKDWDPAQPLKWAMYSRENALKLIEGTGWEVESLNDPEPYIQHYIIARPI